MAINSIFEKMKDSTSTITKSVNNIVKIQGSEQNKKEGTKNLSSIKKEIETLNTEFSRLMNVIGREAYDLYKENELNNESLEGYFTLATKIKESKKQLIAEKEVIEKQNQKYRICDCGNKLEKNAKFCPQCGLEVDDGTITCRCGVIYKKTEKFCSECGNDLQKQLEDILKSTEVIGECVCGTSLIGNQEICMECGRLIE